MKNEIRILQLIDSLDAGGAERMAVNYANALADVIPFSALVSTRKEGSLKAQLDKNVHYLFLNKRRKVDLNAVFKLKKFTKQHKITMIHAHSSSFFTAVLVKLIYPKVKLIWHDHYGNSAFLEQRSSVALRAVSSLFQGIISVNLHLKEWATNQLNFRNAIYLPNFVFFTDEYQSLKQTNLVGNLGKKIICLANLRPQKNQLMVLKVAELLKKSHGDWSFHLVGKDFSDAYSKSLRKEIIHRELSEYVFIYGSKNDIAAVLNQSTIAVLTSTSEGLPVALLEYGFFKKPIIATRVGDIPKVIENQVTGLLVDSDDDITFYNELVRLIENADLRNLLAENLNEHVLKNYSKEAVIKRYLDWLENK